MNTGSSEFNSIVVNGRYRVHQVTGVQRYAREIVRRLTQDVEVICPDRKAKGLRGHAWEQSTLAYAARNSILWNPCGSGPLAHRRHITTFHDLFPIDFPEWYGSRYSAWYGFAMMRLAKQATHLIAVSEYTKTRLVALCGCDPANITVVPNGCTTIGRASQDAIDAAKRKLKLEGKRYILSLSSYEKRKNLKTTLAAWAQIHAKLPENVWLVLSGARPDPNVYASQTLQEDLPRVIFTGYVPEEHLAGLYSGASLFVFPSLAEGFGLPLLEAMGCGARCITSSTTSMPEVGGDVVDYVDPSNPKELADKMLYRMTCGDDGPFVPAMERAAAYSWDAAASKTAEVFRSVRSADSLRTKAKARRFWNLDPDARIRPSLSSQIQLQPGLPPKDI